jgi:hypothetical protein
VAFVIVGTVVFPAALAVAARDPPGRRPARAILGALNS